MKLRNLLSSQFLFFIDKRKMNDYDDFDEWRDSMLMRMKRIKISIFLMTCMSIGILLKDNVILNLTDASSSTSFVKMADLEEIEEAISSLKGFRDVLQYKNDYEIKQLIQDFETNKNMLMQSTQESSVETNQEPEEESDDKDSCDGKWFDLVLMLDNDPTEVSWELRNEETNAVVAHESYTDDDRYTQQIFFLCVAPGPYVFSLFDSSKNGIDCITGGKGCYKIFLEDEMIIEGPEFDGEIAVHYFNSSTSAFCTVGSIFTLQLRLELEILGQEWHLMNNKTKEFIKIFPLSQNEKKIEGQRSYVTCLSPGKYDLILLDTNGNTVSCNNDNSDCMLNSIGDEILALEGRLFQES